MIKKLCIEKHGGKQCENHWLFLQR